jgi:hypothetical protein
MISLKMYEISEPVATITPSITVTEYKPAPVVAYFSSRGPSAQTGNILKVPALSNLLAR